MGNRFSLKTIKKICCATTAAVALLLQMTGTAYAAGITSEFLRTFGFVLR